MLETSLTNDGMLLTCAGRFQMKFLIAEICNRNTEHDACNTLMITKCIVHTRNLSIEDLFIANNFKWRIVKRNFVIMTNLYCNRYDVIHFLH